MAVVVVMLSLSKHGAWTFDIPPFDKLRVTVDVGMLPVN
jgi:hypothetical protein